MNCNPTLMTAMPSAPRRPAVARLQRVALAWVLASLAWGGAPQAACGQTVQTAPVLESVGMVKTLSGQAFMDVGGQRYPAALGMSIYAGSRLVTTPGSTLGVSFKDNTVMSIGPDTQLVIDQYLYAPRQGQLGLVASLLRGSLNYVSGQIAKLRPDGVRVNTPTGMIGVRGTQFVARVDPQ